MLNFKNEYFTLEKGRLKYPTQFKDKSFLVVYGSKEGGITGTELTAHIYKIPENYYEINAGQLDFSNYPNGIENDFLTIRVTNLDSLFSLPLNFTDWKDISPENLTTTFEKIGDSILDIQKRLSEVAVYIDSGKPDQINLPKLPVGCTWYKDQDENIVALPISDLYGKFQQMIDKLYKDIRDLLDIDYGEFNQGLRDKTDLLLKELTKETEKLLDILANHGNNIKPKQVSDIEFLKRVNAKLNEVYEVLGYYKFDDGANHKRVISNTDDGSGVQLNNGLWANIVHNGEVNVSWFGAKQNVNEDQSSYIQKAINWFSKCRKIIIDKTYQIDNSISFPIDSSDITIIGYGGKLKYTGTETALKLELTRSPELNYYPQYFYIKGLKIVGNYKCNGISIKQFDNWKLEDVQVWYCLKGIVLESTYYGEISGKSTIRNCLTGIFLHSSSASDEVNTINLDNIGINFATSKEKFIPKNSDESEEDYNNRVISKGIHIQSLVFGSKFNGLTIEGQDYGIHSEVWDKANEKKFNRSIYSITNCYFEAIKSKNIYINNYEAGYLSIQPIINIIGNRFFNLDKPIDIDNGTYNIFMNEPVKLVATKGSLKAIVNTDLKLDENTKISKSYHFPSNTDIESFGGSSSYPINLDFLKTWEHENRMVTVFNSSTNIEVYPKYSVTHYPLTFNDRKNSVILKDENNKFYALIMQDGKLRTKAINNNNVMFPPANTKTALYAQKNIDKYKENDEINIFELDIKLKKVNGVWAYRNWTISFIGTADYFSKNLPPSGSWYNPYVYNIETGFIYNWQSSYWSWCSSDCLRLQNNLDKDRIRAIGTTAERPNIANKKIAYCFVYYNTDTKKYEMFKDGQWVEWDKIVRIDTDDYYDDSLPAQLNTPYMATKMQQEGVYNDYITYNDEKVAYDKQQKKLEEQRQLTYEEALKENPNLTYEEFMSVQPMTLNLVEEPQPSEALKKFMEKYL